MPTMLQTTDETTALLSSLKDRIAALEKSSWSAGTRDKKKDDADATTGTAADAAVVDITPELRRDRMLLERMEALPARLLRAGSRRA